MSRNNSKILIVEDTGSIAAVFKTWLKKNGYDSEVVETGPEGLEKLRSTDFSLVLLDIDLPEISGIEILKAARQEGISTPAVMVTASGSINAVIEAMRCGAYDYLVKPTAEERLITTVKNALEHGKLKSTVSVIRKKASKQPKHGFVGSSLPMIAVYRMIDSIAQSKASVFITGESGTGKEVCAEAIHRASSRSDGPFVPINCAAIPKELMESEIFGHLSGTFTGATSDRVGAAISASGGTLFLDEICEMELDLQAKLLRFLQTGQVKRLGSDKLVNVDVRIVAATNRDPVVEVQEGRFREDLFYRLHVLPIQLPALRDRESDALEIAKHLLGTISAEEGKSFVGFTEEAENALLQHSWPGNIRELQNVVRKSVILNEGNEITAEMLGLKSTIFPVFGSAKNVSNIDSQSGTTINVNLEQEFWEIERDIIEAAIHHCKSSIPRASEMLGLSPSTIYRKRESWEQQLGNLQDS